MYLTYPILQTVSAKLTWSHYIELLKIDDPLERSFLWKRMWRGAWQYYKIYQKKYGFNVSSNYIAQIKDKAGLKKRRNYHIGSGQGRVLICPPEKEEAIMDAFRHFNLIWRIRSCSLRRAAFLFRAIGWCCLSLQNPVLCLAKHSKVQNRGFMIFCVNGANCIESFWGE